MTTAVLLAICIVLAGLLLIFGVGHGLDHIAARRDLVRLRKQGRTVSLDVAKQRVLKEGFVFVEDGTRAPVFLWIVEEAAIAGIEPPQMVAAARGLLVLDGRRALSIVKAEPALAARTVVCTPVFVD